MVSREKRVFFVYTILITILVIVGFSLLYVFNSEQSYYLAVRIYTIIEYSTLAYFFSLYIKRKIINNLLLFSIGVYIVFCIYSYAKQKTPEMPFMLISVEHVLLLIFILYYFFETIQNITSEPIYQKAIFWISVAFIINSAGNFFLFLYSKNSFKDDTFKMQYTIIYTTVTILKNIFLCISIPIKESPSKSISEQTLNIDLDPFKPIEQKP